VTGLSEPVAAVAAHALPSRAKPPQRPLDAAEWAATRDTVRSERLWGLLAAAVVDGAFPVTPQQTEEVVREHADAMAAVLSLERILLQLDQDFYAAGICYVVLKGPSLAHTAYPDPSARCYGDIDVLVHRDDLDRTVALLQRAGCTRPYPEIRPGFDRRFGKSVTLIRPDGVELDLHRTFVAGRFGLSVDLDGLFTTSVGLSIGGRTLPIMGSEERLLAACYHAAVGDADPRLMTLRDIAQMVLWGEMDVDRVEGLAERWRARAVLARGLQLAWDRLELMPRPPLVERSAAYRPTAAESRAVASYTVGRSSTAQTLSALGVVSGWRDKVAFLAAVLVPGRGYLDRHGPDPRRYVHWWRRGLRSLRRAVFPT